MLLSRKLAFRFRQYALEKEEIQSPWGSYLLLHACDRKIRWDQLEQAAEQEQLLVILPKGLNPPEEFPFFSADALDESFFRSAVGRLLSQLSCPMSGRQILLADLKGVRLEWLKEWLFYSPVFHVACPNEDLRQALAQQLLEEYGVVLLHDKVIPQHGRGILLDPAGWLRPWKGFQGLVLTAKRMPGKGNLSGTGIGSVGRVEIAGGNFGAGFFSVGFARKQAFAHRNALSGMAKWDSFISEGIAPTSGRKLSGQIMF